MSNPWVIGIIVGVIIAVALGVWKRLALIDFVRRGLNRSYSRLSVVLGTMAPIYMPVDTPEGRRMAWQCHLAVTNDGNRPNAPVRGIIRWDGHDTTFLTPLSNGVVHVSELSPHQSATLHLNAWSPIDGEDPTDSQETRIEVVDRYNKVVRTKVTFSPPPVAIVPPGQCGVSIMKDGQRVICDQPAGHDSGFHSARITPSLVTTWDDNGPAGDYAVS
jgi:hypothetical protein